MEAVAFLKIAAPYIAAGTQVASAFQSLSAGRMQADTYKLQAKQAQLKASRDALQYEQQANSVYERLLQTNATAAARGFAGGVQGFSGSAKLIQERNEKVAGRDINIIDTGAKEAKSFGEVQASMLRSAADEAITGSYFDALSKIGTAAFMYQSLRPGDVSSVAGTSAGTSIPINYSDPFLKKGLQLQGL